MATDDERRRVAAALREMHDYETAIPIIRTCLGLRPGMLMDDETRRRMSDRLADLIDPGDTSQGCRDTVACDREALLTLAKWLDARASDLLKTNSIDHSRRRVSARKEHAMDLMTACGLIREACGEAANGLPTRGASRTPGPGGRAQVGGAGRAAGEGARHEKN